MPAGAPTKYAPEYCELVEQYIAECVDYLDENGKLVVNVPSHEGLVSFFKKKGIKIVKKTLYNWRDQHEEFLHSLDEITSSQKQKVLNQGLAGNYNPTIAKLILSSNHGMSEKTQTDITSKGEKVSFYLPQKDNGMETS